MTTFPNLFVSSVLISLTNTFNCSLSSFIEFEFSENISSTASTPATPRAKEDQFLKLLS